MLLLCPSLGLRYEIPTRVRGPSISDGWLRPDKPGHNVCVRVMFEFAWALSIRSWRRSTTGSLFVASSFLEEKQKKKLETKKAWRGLPHIVWKFIEFRTSYVSCEIKYFHTVLPPFALVVLLFFFFFIFVPNDQLGHGGRRHQTTTTTSTWMTTTAFTMTDRRLTFTCFAAVCCCTTSWISFADCEY